MRPLTRLVLTASLLAFIAPLAAQQRGVLSIASGNTDGVY